MESVVLVAFALTLTGCMLLGLPLLLALVIGYAIFFGYGLYREHSAAEMLRMSLSGVRTVKNILILFLMIGLLTALWRTGGTIPAIVYYSTGMVRPSVMVVMVFLLNCMVSLLTGTAFGTAATMGVISMAMASSMGIDPVISGGAILSGVFFGDRCSPVSTSALLVAELTQTDIFQNIRAMMKTALVPFLATCAIYGALGFSFAPVASSAENIQALFAAEFRLGWLPLVPAAIILILALFRVNVKVSMLCSILSALAVSLWFQGAEFSDVLKAMVLGFRAENPEMVAMLDGGGIASMLRVAAIICLSSSYAGIFEGTGLLEHLKARVQELSLRVSPYGCILGCSVAASMIACNQTLAIMLTHQVCRDAEPDSLKMAIELANTAVVVAPLVPWSIAGAVPLSSVGAPTASILAACYLYLLPLYHLAISLWRKPKAVR